MKFTVIIRMNKVFINWHTCFFSCSKVTHLCDGYSILFCFVMFSVSEDTGQCPLWTVSKKFLPVKVCGFWLKSVL